MIAEKYYTISWTRFINVFLERKGRTGLNTNGISANLVLQYQISVFNFTFYCKSDFSGKIGIAHVKIPRTLQAFANIILKYFIPKTDNIRKVLILFLLTETLEYSKSHIKEIHCAKNEHLK